MLKSKRTNKQMVSYIPRNDQTIIIGKLVIHFQQYDKGMLVLMDYLQLISDNVNIYNLKYMNLKYSKNSLGDPNKDLFSKIVLGDKSDNIKGIFKKCNKKELEKYYNDKEYFYLQLNSNEELLNRYNLNCKIIDFNYIPIELQNKFISLSLSSLSSLSS